MLENLDLVNSKETIVNLLLDASASRDNLLLVDSVSIDRKKVSEVFNIFSLLFDWTLFIETVRQFVIDDETIFWHLAVNSTDH